MEDGPNDAEFMDYGHDEDDDNQSHEDDFQFDQVSDIKNKIIVVTN